MCVCVVLISWTFCFSVCLCSVNFMDILFLLLLILFYIVSFLVHYYVVFSTFHFQYSKLTLILSCQKMLFLMYNEFLQMRK